MEDDLLGQLARYTPKPDPRRKEADINAAKRAFKGLHRRSWSWVWAGGGLGLATCLGAFVMLTPATITPPAPPLPAPPLPAPVDRSLIAPEATPAEARDQALMQALNPALGQSYPAPWAAGRHLLVISATAPLPEGAEVIFQGSDRRLILIPSLGQQQDIPDDPEGTRFTSAIAGLAYGGAGKPLAPPWSLDRLRTEAKEAARNRPALMPALEAMTP